MIRDFVFESMDNAKENGYDQRFEDPNFIAEEIGNLSDPFIDSEELVEFVIEWQEKEKLNK